MDSQALQFEDGWIIWLLRVESSGKFCEHGNEFQKMGRRYILTRLKVGEEYYDVDEDKLAHSVLKNEFESIYSPVPTLNPLSLSTAK